MDRYIEFVTNHWLMFVGLIVVTALLMQDLVETLMRRYKVTTATGAVAMLNNDGTAVIDVREPSEFVKGHIENAINISVNKLEERKKELEDYRNGDVIVTCQTGTRSPQACNKLVKLGFENVYILRGGMQAWDDLSLPIKRTKK